MFIIDGCERCLTKKLSAPTQNPTEPSKCHGFLYFFALMSTLCRVLCRVFCRVFFGDFFDDFFRLFAKFLPTFLSPFGGRFSKDFCGVLCSVCRFERVSSVSSEGSQNGRLCHSYCIRSQYLD